MTRPVVFIDVDGVIATYVDPDNDYSDPRVGWRLHEELGIRYNPQVLGWLHELHRVADVRFLTAWGERARTLLAPELVLPRFEVVQNHGSAEGFDWKTTAVVRQLSAEDRPVIWIEDDLLDREAVDGLITRSANGEIPAFFFVRTTPGDGLTEAHMIRIRSFIRHNSSADRAALT